MAVRLFPDDVVETLDDSHEVGEVLLIHEEAEAGIRHLPWEDDRHALRRHSSVSKADYKTLLSTGVPPKDTVVVHWERLDDYELIAASKVRVLDRSLFSGDIVKRHEDDAMSGVVLTTMTSCTLSPVPMYTLDSGTNLWGFEVPHGQVTKQLIKQNQPAVVENVAFTELQSVHELELGDLVIYGDWIGHVSSLALGYTLLLHNSTVVEVTQMDDATILDADVQIGDILQTKKGTLRKGRWIFGQYNASADPIGTVVAIRTIEAGVEWLHSRATAIMNSPPDHDLDRVALESSQFRVYDKSQAPVKPSDSIHITQTEPDLSVGSRVKFKDLAIACDKYQGQFTRVPRSATAGYDLTVFDVSRTQRQVRVMWQDLSISEHNSTELMPDISMDDEHSAWPGEIAVGLALEPVRGLPGCYAPSKVGVVQSVRARDRLAMVRWCSEARVHYGIEEETLGVPKLEAPKTLVQSVIGLCHGPSEEVSLYDIDTPGALNVRRGDIVLINTSALGRVSELQGANWLGEIVQDGLDGSLLIRLGAATPVKDIVFRREEITLAIRSEDSVFNDDDDEMEELDESMDTDEYSDSDGYDTDEDMASVLSLNMHEITYADESGNPLAESEVEDDDWESASEQAEAESEAQYNTHGLLVQPSQPSNSSQAAPVDQQNETEMPRHMMQYELLDDEAPFDHHFVTRPSFSGSGLKRMQKEHKILQKAGALPAGVFVRAWESRLDLLRVLLIGPLETPYANAPFAIDFWLPPAFPEQPPEAFFHSWTGEASLGGIGKVNPNLYEDGTICLSLLGTWSGERQENWNASSSTMLQVIVSLLGLVLVREPYFNEAGYEHLAGTAAARRPSILYNERASVRALSFTISAVSAIQLDQKLAGLSSMRETVRGLYIAPQGPMLLNRVHEHVRAIFRRSEETKDEADGINVLSQGACIQLRRVLDHLQTMLPA